MNPSKKYSGVIVPAITPLTERLQIDETAVEKLFGTFYDQGIAPFILGTTGESASIPFQVKKDYIHAAERIKKPGTLLYAGIGSNVLAESTSLAAFCALHGVDVLQMKEYFTELANTVPLPLFIYNIPATTHMSIPLQLAEELSHHPNIVGIKDSERSEERLKESVERWKSRTDFHYILGWATQSANALLMGADGLVPSTGNLYPELYAEMIRAFEKNDTALLLELQEKSDTYGSLYQSGRTLGESLKVLKQLMEEKGICKSVMMPPL
jgi:dihydrodipicolinate synthase/N-acetylneuraminate lyase